MKRDIYKALLEWKASSRRETAGLQMQPSVLVRSNLLNLKKDGKILNLPLYMISQLGRLL